MSMIPLLRLAQSGKRYSSSRNTEIVQTLAGNRSRWSVNMIADEAIADEANGGARRDRTDDLMLAKHALSQLSYGPNPAVRRR